MGGGLLRILAFLAFQNLHWFPQRLPSRHLLPQDRPHPLHLSHKVQPYSSTSQGLFSLPRSPVLSPNLPPPSLCQNPVSMLSPQKPSLTSHAFSCSPLSQNLRKFIQTYCLGGKLGHTQGLSLALCSGHYMQCWGLNYG